MIFIRLCFDKPDTDLLRDKHRAAHRAYLASGVVKLVQAGPLMDDENKKNIASFMVVEADSLERVYRFHDGDPFTKAGLFKQAFIHIWDKHEG
jgi:uncharacterized protein